MTAFVFSTLSTDMSYTFYVKGGGDIPIKERSVNIKGGANVANDRIITPLGVMTEIEDEEAALLKDHPVFKMHEANGFVVVETRKADPDKAAKNMSKKDKSAPITPEDYEDGKDAPSVKGA